VIAPKDFMEHAIKENILASNAMTRRASYQYGSALEKSPTGQVDAAIGKGLLTGFIGLIAPTRVIEENQETLTIDGVTMIMQNTPVLNHQPRWPLIFHISKHYGWLKT
jgi:alkyl sulfatase BDS1-like metallo-beta-lactamase superfamily hydrolase